MFIFFYAIMIKLYERTRYLIKIKLNFLSLSSHLSCSRSDLR